ncbi:O-acetyl-ADP-ribose deacetylase [Undibacterium cyanobacteriorum]|uniref:O-acetyl-ADP-ribose deacetylase n=1 Tax=Undibacterium cyanobacteriorum TaxID=3073561 RepID=A0ABY9RIZ0_9BURK|nr:O-acetyl-ADP-ribose deacetylase [Undibacterium sp. 20NA77.5]WMW80307.1 O-acetyl-ADP-ribose deacetylase [Undibacterium sp. 20NA77.5]
MKITILKSDITKLTVDVIVNAANSSLLGGGGVDGAIHRAAGKALLEECHALHGCKAGQAKYTQAYALPAKYVIHTVGPVWQGGQKNEAELLRSCYQNSLAIARDLGVHSIAFPAISTGAYRYPLDEATRIAISSVQEFAAESGSVQEVVFCCFSDADEACYRTAYAELTTGKNGP